MNYILMLALNITISLYFQWLP